MKASSSASSLELKTAGFTTIPDSLPAGRAGNPSKHIALTFDDGFVNVLPHALEPLARHGFRAIEFLVAGLLGCSNEWEQRQGESREALMDPAQVRAWLAAGHLIGSHTLTHPFLTQVSLRQAREEIFASKQKLEDLFGLPIRNFCYPYGDWNSVVRDLVAEAGYETACTTEFGVNTAAVAPFELRRITARHQTRSVKALWAWLGRSLRRRGPRNIS